MDTVQQQSSAQGSETEDSLFLKVVKGFQSVSILNFLAMLQLVPQNIGFTELFEELVRITHLYRRENDQRPFASWDLLLKAMEEINEDVIPMEPANAFTDNVVYAEGNYIVYPGLYSAGAEILNELIEAIFIKNNKLPEAFKKEVNEAVGIMLFISDGVARLTEHTRYLFEEPGDDISYPAYDDFITAVSAVQYKRSYLKKVYDLYHYNPNCLDPFIVRVNDRAISEEDPDKNIVIRKPLAEIGEEIIVCMPTSILSALIHHIYDLAKADACYPALVSLMSKEQFKLANLALSKMGWSYTSITLPENKTSLPALESVWQFDNEKLGYLCFIDFSILRLAPLKTDLRQLLDQRNAEVTAFLNKLEPKQYHPVLTLFLIAETGIDGLFAGRKSTPGNYALSLRFTDLLTIAYADSSDRLTLWKFARAYNDLGDQLKIMAMGGPLDAYVVFERNKGNFVDSDRPRPRDMMIFVPGNANDLVRQVQLSRDEHAVKFFEKGMQGHVKVLRVRKYAPVYQLKEPAPGYRVMTESYPMPVWVSNYQKKAKDYWTADLCECVVYWLYKMRDDLAPLLAEVKLIHLEIELKIDVRLLKGRDFIVKTIDTAQVEVKSSVVPPRIVLDVPYDFMYVAGRADNLPDKLLVKAALNGMVAYIRDSGAKTALNQTEIDRIVEKHLQPAQAKMVLFSDSAANVRLDNRGLPPERYIQDSDISRVLDNLVSYLPAGYQIPVDIPLIDDRIKFCDDVVNALEARIMEKIRDFDGPELLAWLIKWNERCVFTREFREIQIPAKIVCFSEFSQEVQHLLKKDERLVPTAQSLRSLIEFVAMSVPSGTKWPNYDDIDELLALTEQLINWGSLSEAMRARIDDPRIGLLPSGRIGTDKTFQRQAMEPYTEVRMSGEVLKYVEQFEQNYLPQYHGKVEPSPESLALDEAFQAEFGITLTNLSAVTGLLINAGFQSNKNCLTLTETEVYALLSGSAYQFDDATIAVALGLMTLLERPAIMTAPEGYTPKDIFAWRFSRSLSYLRRPLVAYRTKDGIPHLMFGYRHLMAYIDNTLFLLYTGKMPEKTSKKMSSWLGTALKAKGNPFRKTAYDWFATKTGFEVIEHEVTMDKNGHIVADRDYGDIDVMAIDHENRLIYSVECKNNIGARNIHEMKVEMDLYLGREGNRKKAKIRMHVDRHGWLTTNPGSLAPLVKNPASYKVISLILTAEEMPLSYIVKDQVPLPMIGFANLKLNGTAVLPK